MQKKLFSADNFYLFGLLVLAAALPLSKYVMSIGQLILAGAWLADGRFVSRLKRFFTDKRALALVSIYFLHIIGLLYSTDVDFGTYDLRIKLPLLILPFMLATKPVERKSHLHLILAVFIAAVFVSTLISSAVFAGFTAVEITNMRDISIFISHIRLSLMVVLAIFFMIYFIAYSRITLSSTTKIACVILIAWFVTFLLMLESITGLVILTITSLILITIKIIRSSRPVIKYSFVGLLIIIPLSIFFYIKGVTDEYYTLAPESALPLETKTKDGGQYEHRLDNTQTENGHYVWRYVCWNELGSSWNNRSSFKFNGKDKRDQDIKYTLIRYMTSKGLRKDRRGVDNLTAQDIQAVEDGYANYKYLTASSVRMKVYKIIWQLDNYLNGGNPSGHSVSQRIEYWKTALSIIKENPLFGTGTGDLKIAYAEKYDETNSKLRDKYRLARPHNQFLSITVILGTLGLIVFLISLFGPATIGNSWNDYLYLVFFIIMISSMLPEDTIETQAGVTFFAFFNALLLFRKNCDVNHHL